MGDILDAVGRDGIVERIGGDVETNVRTEGLMRIADFLSQEDVLIGVTAADKSDLLTKVSAHAAGKLSIDCPNIVHALIARETLGSTGMGGGIALPHARLPQIAKPFGVFVRLAKPIAFDAIDGAPIDLAFLLLLPNFPASVQLPALACVARQLREPSTASAVRRAASSKALFDAVAG
jgi:PTS system nitrogen regulatory IIA component